MAALALAFVVVPFVELFVLIQVGQAVGTWPTIAALVAVSILGAWLAKREGLGVWRRLRGSVGAGRLPGREIVDGALVLFAGALLLTPGFLTDVFGLALLVPPSRAVVREVVLSRLARRARLRSSAAGGGPWPLP